MALLDIIIFRSGMYKDFFGLRQLPFNLTPDPAFLYLPPKHRDALAGMTYAVLERKGFVVLSGAKCDGRHAASD